jgi:hypothetical protein
MTRPTPLPATQDVAALFRDLLGVSAGADRVKPPLAADEAFRAYYLKGEDTPFGAMLLDRELAVRASAALAMLPPGGLAERLEAGEVDGEMRDHLAEVANVCSGLFPSKAFRVRLAGLFAPGEAAPEAWAAVLASPAHRVDFNLSLGAYGGGRLAVCAG